MLREETLGRDLERWLQGMRDNVGEFRAWALERPPDVRAVMDRFPVGCFVRAVDGRSMMCPAPGERAAVLGYQEYDDHVAVRVQPILRPENPLHAVTARLVAGSDDVTFDCHPDWLEVVDSEPQLAFYREVIGQ